ncbi:MAG TPA: SCP2 sterol-binding domain-containing protein [Steroidobacter sp.]|nr:SCP2 sterol-binding domain-containing protein [Steroidobacter sp.]
MRARSKENLVLHPSTVFSTLLRAVPEPLSAHAVALTVTHLLRGQALTERLGELAGRRFRLQLDDVPASFTFEIGSAGLKPSALDPHVTIRGALADFAALALRKEDPDTLFFQRRLVVEGETETGLHLKNLLDGWEYDAPGHVQAVLPAPLARVTLATAGAARSLFELARLRRPGNRRNNRPAGMTPGA